MDKTENGGQSLVFPIVLKASTDLMIAGWLFCGFFSLVMLLFGLIMGAWTVCGLAVLILAAYGIVLYGQKRKAFVFERDQVTVQTAFSQVSYSYEGMDALICRSVTMNLSRSNWSACPDPVPQREEIGLGAAFLAHRAGISTSCGLGRAAAHSQTLYLTGRPQAAPTET